MDAPLENSCVRMEDVQIRKWNVKAVVVFNALMEAA